MFSKVSSKNLIANKAKAVHTEVCTDACQPCDVWIKFARLLLNRIGSSVIIYLCSRARSNQPLLIACKSIKIFQHIQISMKKIFVFFPFKAKTNLCTTHFSVCTALRVQRYNNFLIYEDFFLFLISV